MTIRILTGDCRDVLPSLPAESVHCVVTSPPYWGLRDYGVSGQIGLEACYVDYVETLVATLRHARRVLRSDGTLWLNLGDTYARDPGKGDRSEYLGLHKNISDSGCHTASQKRSMDGLRPKNLVGIPWRVAFALQADGWYLRQDIIWSKPNPMPESVRDRCTKAHEYIFLLSKSERYCFNADAIKEPASVETHPRGPGNQRHKGTAAYEDGDARHRTKAGLVAYSRKLAAAGSGTKNNRSFDEAMSINMPEFRNKRSVWTVGSEPFSEAHFATFPPALIEPCILAGCPKGGTVLDPFGGAGTTGLVADRLQRDAILIEFNPEYAEMARRRIRGDAPLFVQEAAE